VGSTTRRCRPQLSQGVGRIGRVDDDPLVVAATAAGPLIFNIGWPEKGAPLSSATAEAFELITASQQAERLW
jgi:hypothetical protein